VERSPAAEAFENYLRGSIEEKYIKAVGKIEAYLKGENPPEEVCDLVNEIKEANHWVKIASRQNKELYEVYEYHLFDGGNGNYFIARGKEVPTTDL